MAKFYVGQWVRVVKTYHRHDLVGAETVVIGIINPDQVQVDIKSPSGGHMRGQLHQFEPIQYDGMQPVEWAECLWQPEGVTT